MPITSDDKKRKEIIEIPDDRHYTETHEWVDINTGKVGITDIMRAKLGAAVFVMLPEVNDHFASNDELCVVEGTTSVVDIYSPVNGDVIEVNGQLNQHPELLNEDPYSDGWLMKMDFHSHSEKDSLLSAEGYLMEL